MCVEVVRAATTVTDLAQYPCASLAWCALHGMPADDPLTSSHPLGQYFEVQ